ncbi:N utilization substance protein B [Marmoricola sp. Leaf446]|uniref:transcription antitermination factor NusB n=1 Tax=Marmoricola sp. Leaf446 TaxID=1736379 RepID=UPI0006F5F298|nr:transcription antitermination factor NusB [Marmoricola sp. Leaf446]KQT89136.1 N utilization substance protein B [Marmoricola sp. Leaf446]
MAARSKARKRALDAVYAADMRSRPPAELLAEQAENGPVNEYTQRLVDGVHEHRHRLDEVITDYAQGWTLRRMPAVDRNVLRLAVFEILFVDDVPDAVAVSEALKLVGDLSTDESPAFVNGVLGNIVRDREQLVGQA